MASLLRTLRRNAIFSALSSVVRLSTTALLFILVARAYGPEAFGQFTTAHTLSLIFTLFADFGFDLLLTTEVARKREEASFLFPRILWAKLVCTTIVCLSMCLYGLLLSLSEPTRVLTMIFSSYLLFSALMSFMFALFRAHDELHHEAQITFVVNVLLLGALVILGAIHASLYLVAVVFVLSRVLGLAIAWHRSRSIVTVRRPVRDPAWLAGQWREIMAFGLYFVFGNLFFTIDTVLLSMIKGDYHVGIYQAVFRIAALFLMLPEVALSAILPSLARVYVTDTPKWTQMGTATSKFLFFIGLLIGTILVTLGDLVITLVYGRQGYEEAIPVMRIFGGIVVIRYAFAIPGMMLTTSGRQPVLTLIFICATVITVGSNLFVIPPYGINGAAVVSLITNGFVMAAIFLALRSHVSTNWLAYDRLVPLGLALIGIAVILSLPPDWRWIGVLALLLVFLPVVYLAGFSISERRLVKEAALQIVSRQGLR